MEKNSALRIIVILVAILAAVVLLGVAGVRAYLTARDTTPPTVVANNTPPPSGIVEPPPLPAAEDVALFRERCSGCHGEDGSRPPSWAAEVREMTVEQRMATIRTGKGRMPAFDKRLSDDEIARAAVYAGYIAAQKK